MNNKILKFSIVLVGLIGIMLYALNQNSITDEITTTGKKDSIINNKIKKLRNAVNDLKINDSILKQKLSENNNRFNNIILTLKRLDNEKKINDNKIRNYSYNDNWNWFKNRFSKQNYRIPTNADTTVRQPSKNRQLKSN